MKTEFIPYEQALALKELGFDEPCLAYYDKDGDLLGDIGINEDIDNLYRNSYFVIYKDFSESEYTAPLYQQCFRWFREKYNWQHSIDPTSDQHSFELGYNYWIWNYKTGEEYHTMPKNRPTGDWEFETYEEAELACLNKLIEIVKNEQ